MKTKTRKKSAPRQASVLGEEPLFEVWTGPRGTKRAKRYAIHANGRLEGFGEDAVSINRLPRLIRKIQKRIEAAQSAAIDQEIRPFGE